MVKIEVKATVTKEGKLILAAPVDVPTEIAPGEHIVQLTIDGLVEAEGRPLDIPSIHIDTWPEHLSLRREDMYDDWGR